MKDLLIANHLDQSVWLANHKQGPDLTFFPISDETLVPITVFSGRFRPLGSPWNKVDTQDGLAHNFKWKNNLLKHGYIMRFLGEMVSPFCGPKSKGSVFAPPLMGFSQGILRFSKLDQKAGLKPFCWGKPAYFDFPSSIFNVQVHILTTTGDALMGNIKHEIASELKLRSLTRWPWFPTTKSISLMFLVSNIVPLCYVFCVYCACSC